MGIIKRFLNQTRKPEGILGSLMLRGMNSGHAILADWALSQLPAIVPQKAVDLGCGGGRNVSALLQKYPQAVVDGVDYSPLSVEKAIRYNAASIARGKCTISVGDVSELQIAPNTYDLATAFETIYFWPGLEKCFANVHRVLKNDGCFLVVCESDGNDGMGDRYEKLIEGMKVYKVNEIESALKSAGFKDIKTIHLKGFTPNVRRNRHSTLFTHTRRHQNRQSIYMCI